MIEIFNRPEFLLVLLALNLGFIFIGRAYRLYLQKKQPDDEAKLGPIETVIFYLFGLLLAFTFSGSWTRFEERKEIVGHEADLIRSVYLRTDMMSDDAQPKMRALLKEYTAIRADAYQTNDEDILKADYARVAKLRKQMWDLAVLDVKNSKMSSIGVFILTSISALFDVSRSQTAARKNHPPFVIYLMLILLNLFCALLIGYNLVSKNGHWLYVISYATIISSLLYLVIEIELPRHGLISVHEVDQFIIDLRDSM